MNVGVVVPSYYNEEWEKNITRFRDSLQFIKDVNHLTFLFNFQNIPMKDAHIKDIISSLFNIINESNPSWNYYYQIVKGYNPVAMCTIRNDCMMMKPDCDLYLFVDDDMYFKQGSGEHYQFTIDHFEEDSELGLVMSASYLGGYNYVRKLKYDTAKIWMNNRGLFLRNIHRCKESPIYPADLLKYGEGGCEDTLAALEIFNHNLKLATHFNCPTMHPPIPQIESTNTDEDNDEIHDYNTTSKTIKEYVLRTFGIEMEVAGATEVRSLFRTLYKKGLGYRYE